MSELSGDYDFADGAADTNDIKATPNSLSIDDPAEDMKKTTNGVDTIDEQQVVESVVQDTDRLERNRFWIAIAILSLIVGALTIVGVVAPFRKSRIWTGPIALGAIVVSLIWVALVYAIRPVAARLDRVVEVFVASFCMAHPVFVLQVMAELLITTLVDRLYKTTKIFVVRVVMFIVIVFGATIFIESIPEEMLKFVMVWRVRQQPDFNNRYACVVLSVAASMGVGACSIMWDLVLTYWGIYSLPTSLPMWLLERLIPGLIMHVVCGAWLGIGMSKRYFPRAGKQRASYVSILIVPCLIHLLYEVFFNTSIILVSMESLSQLQWVVLVSFTSACMLLFFVFTLWRVIQLLRNPRNYTVMQLYDDNQL
jgi:hypothetical protein